MEFSGFLAYHLWGRPPLAHHPSSAVARRTARVPRQVSQKHEAWRGVIGVSAKGESLYRHGFPDVRLGTRFPANSRLRTARPEGRGFHRETGIECSHQLSARGNVDDTIVPMRRCAFRRAPDSYDETFVVTMARSYLNQTPWTRLRLAAVRDLVEPKEGDRVLDLGCAAGAISHFLSTFGCQTVGIDGAKRATATARITFPALRFEQADVGDLPFEDSSFDKAIAADLVEHLDDSTFRRMLLETRRVLVRGGTLAIYTPSPLHVIERLKRRDVLLAQNPTHVGLRRADELLLELDSAGYVVERNDWSASFIPGVRLLEKVGGVQFEAFRYRLCVRARCL